MDNELSTHFMDYIPANEIVSLFDIDRKELIFRAMRKHVEFVYPLKSQKSLSYYPVPKDKGIFEIFVLITRVFLPFGVENRSYPPGHLIKITDLKFLNALGLNILNELNLLTRFDNENKSLLGYEKIRNTFHKIYFEDLLIPIESAKNLSKFIKQELEDLVSESFEENNEAIKRETKQAKREKIFINWLTDKNLDEVANMKKEDVWEKMKKLDRSLFGVESKHFFRDQKIVTFKSGRKSEQST
jgi:hypothetical protein